MTRPRPTLLLSGFEPFAGERINPSWEVARALAGQQIGGWRVVALQLPCVFGQSRAVLQQALRRWRPAGVIALGLAGNRGAISVERVALNLVDARMADNAGARPVDVPVLPGAPFGLATRLPAKAIVARLQAEGLRAELSLSAGSFVCNELMYGLLHGLRRRPKVPAGFIHLPPLPEQAARHPAGRAMPLAEQVQGIGLAIGLLAAGIDELHTPGGRLS
ncbi:pyroglutamyl-peptidase I [Aquabacterium sp. OR-4]|uniref:pyroglutamyl-peptidase I n=1 Tax=Aquabacterium sp. OR-4 TaxID=2978127 RepID=UPI0021B17EDF|nr:pyroglutamyl-peptidase I [Aquabacterium sp. OR-4]MDT7837154.1 pyroglutamyl-peptidase I [Aquabacterium sp. OR-4]